MDELATQGVAYVPFFPLGGFSRLQSSELDAIAASVRATLMQVALAWLLQRAPNLLIPNTSSVKHLRENFQAVALQISPETIAELDSIAGGHNKGPKAMKDKPTDMPKTLLMNGSSIGIA
jgi:diketogulonate reductase-like aldo/keto reductase